MPADTGRTTLGQAVGEEAQRRWDKRRAAAGAGKTGAGKVSLTKDKDGRGKRTDGKDDKTAKEPLGGAPAAGKD
ncbi:ATP/GTP-binding protein, partial [Streptomyces halstedii]|nr:ATP/GTP-binding protein [Streptomyces halstedii]